MISLLRIAVLLLATSVAGSAYALDKVVMQLGWIPGGDRAYYYLAKQGGFFAREDLDVQIKSGKGANDAITKVATGVADFGEAGLDAVLTARVNADVPVVVVMPMLTKMPDALITTKEGPIKTLKDVAGKRVATSPFTTSNAPWPFVLRANGVDPDKVTLIKTDPSALGAMLASGQADGIIQFVTVVPSTTDVLAAAKKEIRVLPWADYGLEGYSSAIIVSRQTLATRRALVVRFVRALRAAEIAMRADPDKAVAALKAEIPEMDAALALKVVKSTMPFLFNDVTDRAGLGLFSPALVQTTWHWVAREQNVPEDKLDPMASVDMTIGNEAAASN